MSHKSDAVISAYLAHRLDEVLLPKGKLSTRVLGEKIGLSNATIGNVKNGKQGVGIKALKALAGYFELTWDECQAAAEQWVKEHPEALAPPGTVVVVQEPPSLTEVELDDRYPNRAEAAKEARKRGVSEAAIRSVLHDAMESDADLPVKAWLAEMHHREEWLDRLAAQSPEERAAEEEADSKAAQEMATRAEAEREAKRKEREAKKKAG